LTTGEWPFLPAGGLFTIRTCGGVARGESPGAGGCWG